MVLVSSKKDDSGPPLYFRESTKSNRTVRFCLKPVVTVAPRGDRKSDVVNVSIVRGKTQTFIQLEEEEAKKVTSHGDYVYRKIQKISKSIIWNCMIGRSFIDKIQKGKTGNDEINIDHDENLEFNPSNPKTWSDESIDFMNSILKATEFRYDGFVILFSVQNDPNDPTVDFDELAWELEKCLTYHFLGGNKSQVIMNEEACMSRRGLEPVSRKTKTPGRKKSGYCVYMAYQLLDNITHDNIVGESLTKFTDINVKKKQLLGSLTDTRFMPQIDERLRKSVKEIREYLSKDHLEIILKCKDIQDEESLELLKQFMNILSNGKGLGMMGGGLPQFLSFLNKSNDHEPSSTRASSRMSVGNSRSPKVSVQRSSTLPRPTKIRKPSICSTTMSSRSTTPDTPRKMSISADSSLRSNGRNGRHNVMEESGLESIPDTESNSSTPETMRRIPLRTPTNPPPAASSGTSVRRTNSLNYGKPTSNIPSTNTMRGRTQSNGRPKSSSLSAPAPSKTPTPTPRGKRTAGMSPAVAGQRSNSQSPAPSPSPRITRADLRKMNNYQLEKQIREKKEKAKQRTASFSRASITS